MYIPPAPFFSANSWFDLSLTNTVFVSNHAKKNSVCTVFRAAVISSASEKSL